MFPENNYGIIHLIGDDSKVDTPLPIPNREVKHFNGENSVSEDSKLPIFFCTFLFIYMYKKTVKIYYCSFFIIFLRSSNLYTSVLVSNSLSLSINIIYGKYPV